MNLHFAMKAVNSIWCHVISKIRMELGVLHIAVIAHASVQVLGIG